MSLTLALCQPLSVEPADLITFSNGHREVGGQIDSALDADCLVVATLPAAYGTVGAVFAAAVDGFEVALQRTGAALAGEYRRTSEALEVASALYVRTDQVSGAAVALSGALDSSVCR